MNRLPIADTNFSRGSTICESNTCEVSKDCANHETAGDYRSESGHSPILSYTGGELGCGGEFREGWSGLIFEEDGSWKAYNGFYSPEHTVIGPIEDEADCSTYSPAIPSFKHRGEKQSG